VTFTCRTPDTIVGSISARFGDRDIPVGRDQSNPAGLSLLSGRERAPLRTTLIFTSANRDV
jgi:hypothetical protein